MKNIFTLILIFISLNLFAQQIEEQAIIRSIETMFDGMRERDSTKLLSVIFENADLKTTYISRAGKPQIKEETMQNFITSVTRPHDEIYDEKIWSYEIKIDGILATAWTEYTFFLGEKMLHCGVNAFQLMKTDEGWKIFGITDTRRKDGCKTERVEEIINKLLDAWHHAAAIADEDTFFEGTMTEDAIYLGTDATERWTRDELKEWSKKYFETESAWSFTAKERNVYFSKDGKTAWFDEKLDTWMGDCRGSGVLVLTAEGGWKLKHYDLSMMVPNDKVDSFLKLLKK
jgi:SnoaL-like protein